MTTIPATRGLILARDGKPLVDNVTTVEIRLSRAEAALYPPIKGALASLTGLSVKQINADLSNPQYDPYQPAPISPTPATEVEFIKLHPKEFPGVSVLNVSTRTYPNGGALGAQILGYVGPITGEEIKQNPDAGYQTDSVIGKTGIEAYYEKYLRGHDGTSTLEVNAYGDILGSVKTTNPTVGDSVVLNIDTGLQQRARRLSRRATSWRCAVPSIPSPSSIRPRINGAAIVMDPNTGAVLAMSSYPSFNLQSFVNGLSEATYQQLLSEGAFNNYAIQGLYTPGSTFKLITATAELQTGIFPAYKYIDDTGTYKVPGCLQGAHGCVFHDDDNEAAGEVDLSRR